MSSADNPLLLTTPITPQGTVLSPTPGNVAPGGFSPSPAIYVGFSDQIQFSWVARGAYAQGIFVARLRILRLDGTIMTMDESIVTTAYGPGSIRFNLCEGWLISASVSNATANIDRGYMYVQLTLGRFTGTQWVPVIQLVADYVCSDFAPSWPTGLPQFSVAGHGLFTTTNYGGFGAGSDFAFNIASSTRVRLVSLVATLVTSATVANRVAGLALSFGGNNYAQFVSAVPQTASLTWKYCWTSGAVGSYAQGTRVMVGIPTDLQVPSGFSVVSLTENIQAGDQYTSVLAMTEEWLSMH